MKRGGPLRRKKRLRQVGRRANAEADALAAFRADPPATCERCGKRRPLHAHHRLPRSRGGEHTAENRAWLCAEDHDLIHRHLVPDWKEWTA